MLFRHLIIRQEFIEQFRHTRQETAVNDHLLVYRHNPDDRFGYTHFLTAPEDNTKNRADRTSAFFDFRARRARTTSGSGKTLCLPPPFGVYLPSF